MKEIALWGQDKITKEKYIKGYAMVDDEDYEWLNGFRWNYSRYVTRAGLISEGDKHRKTISMHKQIMEKYNGSYGYDVKTDHINGNTLNNQKSNLRLCTCQENGMNRKNTVRSSRYKGVRWKGNRPGWEANIFFNGKTIYIGYYKDEIKAALAYNEKAKELFGEYARLNEVA